MGSSDLKLELNEKEAKKSAYFKGGVLREKKVQSPTAGSEVTLPKDKIPEEVIVDKKFVVDKLEKIANILNSAIDRSKVFINAQKTMDKKDKDMCTPPPPPNPKKRRAKQKRIKKWLKEQDKKEVEEDPTLLKRRTILQDRTPPSPEQLEKLFYQGSELRRADQIEVENCYFETMAKGNNLIDPTIRLEGSVLQDVELPIDEMLTRLSKRAYKEAVEKNKWNGTSINDAILWLVSEVLELYRAKERAEGSIEEELADVIIMALSIAGKLEIDIGSEVQKKMEKNKGKGHS